MLVGLSVFRCDSKKFMHDRPSWESERTKEFAAWCGARWRVRSGSFHDVDQVFCFGQSKIDSHETRQPNSMGSSQERLHGKEESEKEEIIASHLAHGSSSLGQQFAWPNFGGLLHLMQYLPSKQQQLDVKSPSVTT